MEKIVEVERIIEKRVEIPVMDDSEVKRLKDENKNLEKEKNRYLEKLNSVEEEMDIVCSAPPQLIEQIVEVPVEKIIEKRVEVPVEKIIERVKFLFDYFSQFILKKLWKKQLRFQLTEW